ncbi:OmpP1/FadL family transporter [Viscerimonas tarda]
MKRLFITASAIFFSLSAFSQGEMDALRYSTNDLTGTARSVGMGGAFGALGGDISGIAINPAGIGVYKSSEVVGTLDFRNNNIETQLNAGTLEKSKFSFSFDNMAFVGVIPTYNEDVPLVNFGFSYNRLKTFDQSYSMQSRGSEKSLTDLMAKTANADHNRGLDLGGGIPREPNFGLAYEDWLPVLGYNSYLINPDQSRNYKPVLDIGETVDNILHVKEKGYINSFDFNGGTTISNIVSVGLTIAVTDFDYRIHSFYNESFDQNNGYSLTNTLQTKGAGLQVKAGVILKPVNELRLGIAYHSPTWYKMTNYFSAGIKHEFSNFVPGDLQAEYQNSYNPVSEVYTRDYDFKTPDKWTFSIAGIIAQTAILSLDYDLTNYQNMSFDEPDSNGFNSYNNDQNLYIKEDFKSSSSIRVGAEIRFTPQFSGRVGYSWVESPVKAVLRDGSSNASQQDIYGSLYVPDMGGPISHFSLPKDANYFTYGLGYKFTPQFYGDIAFVMKSQDSDLYAFGGASKATYKNNSVSGALTFGYKF